MSGPRGRRVVITGGSSGIGLAVAERIVAEGGEVCLVARGADGLAVAREKLGARAWSVTGDVAAEGPVAEVAAAVAARWGALDGLVNNAGMALMATLEATDPHAWDRCFAVNVRGPYLLVRALLPLLRAGTKPAIVNISSTLAEKAIPGMAAYNSAKAALNQLTRSLALELAPTIRVNAVMPGVVDTPIHATRKLTRDQVLGMGRLHPLGRVGQPADVAAVVAFLLSDAAAWMTGAVLPVDGGMLAT